MKSYFIVHLNEVKTKGLKDLIEDYKFENNEDYDNIIPLESYVNVGKCMLKHNNNINSKNNGLKNLIKRLETNDGIIPLESYINLGICMLKQDIITDTKKDLSNKENID